MFDKLRYIFSERSIVIITCVSMGIYLLASPDADFFRSLGAFLCVTVMVVYLLGRMQEERKNKQGDSTSGFE